MRSSSLAWDDILFSNLFLSAGVRCDGVLYRRFDNQAKAGFGLNLRRILPQHPIRKAQKLRAIGGIAASRLPY